MSEDQLLSIDEVAKFLRVSRLTLIRWDKKGILKAVRFGERGDRKYHKSSIKELLERRFYGK